MLYSKLFGKTIRKVPSGVESLNHQLLVKGGFIHQEMAGVFTYLPLGWKVLDKISDIVREEMNEIGGQELLMPALHPADNWEKTGRINGFDVLYRVRGSGGVITNETAANDPVLGPTHEEIIYPLAAEFVKSYHDLPLYLYQIQVKFRNEPRAKAGLLRGREFLMKDLYSFHVSEEDRDAYYEEVRKAYIKIFKRINLPVYETKASGGTFSELSQEFQVVTEGGEDTILYCKGHNCGFAENKEIATVKAGDKCERCARSGHDEIIKEGKAIEVGNIFPLKRAFAETFKLTFTDQDGQEKLVSAGCYGLGISRTMGAVVEVFHDEKGIIWPQAVSPFTVHLVGLDMEDKDVNLNAMKIYNMLVAEGIEVLFDDRVDVSAGAKFADCDLVGIPYRVVISKKTGDKLEVKKRSEKETNFLSFEEFLKLLNF